MLSGPLERFRPSARLRAAAAAAIAGVLLAAAPAAAQAPRPNVPLPPLPKSYLLAPTDQLGFPGQAAGTEVTPEGYLFTGWGELTLNLGPEGKGFSPITRTLELNRYPIVRAFRVDRDILYQLSTFQTSVAGRPVTFARVEMRNLSARVNRARVAAAFRHDGGELAPRFQRCCVRINRFPRPRDPERPGLYFQPGAGFRADAQYSLAGGALLRDGQAMLLYPPGNSRTRVSQQLRSDSGAVIPRTPFGRTLYDVTLPRLGYAALDFKLPVEPVTPGTSEYGAIAGARFTAARSQTRLFWQRLLGGAMRVDLPEAKVEDAFYTSIINNALPRYQLANGQWVQTVNKMRYHAFWLRDGAVITNAFDLVGLHRLARENLDFFLTWQRNSGLFLSRPEEFDGHGQALWAIGEHVRRTGDTAFARAFLPAVTEAMDYVREQRARDPLALMAPMTTTFDNDLVAGHLTGDNFWASAGIAAAVDVARAAGDQAAADQWAAELINFRDTLRGHIARVARPNGPIPPSLDVPGGQIWGMLWGTRPGGVYSATSPQTRATLARARAAFSEGILTYGNRQRLHHYSGFRVFQTELLANQQQKVVRGLYDELAHTTGTHAGFEAGTTPFGDRIVDDSTVPHGWFAAEYVSLLRNMLVREDGATVFLMSALSPGWLTPRKRVSIRNAPTTRGRVTYTLIPTQGGATLFWNANVQPGTRLVWPVPYSVRSVVARGLSRDRRFITLSGRSGRLSVRWRLVGPTESHALQFSRLMAAYQRSPFGAAAAARARTARPPAGQGASDPNRSTTAVAP